MHRSLKKVLESSNNFKVKSKVLILIKQFIILGGTLASNSDEYLNSTIFQARTLLDVLRSFITIYKDSKLQYYSLLNIGLIFQQLNSQFKLINKNQT